MPSRQAEVGSLRRSDIVRTVDYRQTSNAAAVLTATLDHGPVARSSVARLAGLSPAAVGRADHRADQCEAGQGGSAGLRSARRRPPARPH